MALHSIDEDTSKTSNSHPTLSSSSTASSMYSLKSTRSSDVELQAALFAPFCPKIVSEYLQVRAEKHMEPEQSEFYASVLFLDITGFTNLSEAMCQIGPEGVSLLATVINDYFGTLNQLIMAFGGDVLSSVVMQSWLCGRMHPKMRWLCVQHAVLSNFNSNSVSMKSKLSIERYVSRLPFPLEKFRPCLLVANVEDGNI